MHSTTLGNYASYAQLVTSNGKFKAYPEAACTKPEVFEDSKYISASLTPSLATWQACRKSYIIPVNNTVCQSVPLFPSQPTSTALPNVSSFLTAAPSWSSSDFVNDAACGSNCACICGRIAGDGQIWNCKADCEAVLGREVEQTFDSKYVQCLNQYGYDQDKIQKCIGSVPSSSPSPPVIPSNWYDDERTSRQDGGKTEPRNTNGSNGSNGSNGEDSGNGKNDNANSGDGQGKQDNSGVSCDSLQVRSMLDWASSF